MIYGFRHKQDPFSDLRAACSKATTNLRSHKDDFDAIACTGVSGIPVATVVALRLHKKLIIVRKSDDKSTHSYFDVEGVCEGRYVFLDDFIGTGSTIRYVQSQIAKRGDAKIIGAYSYQDTYFYDKRYGHWPDHFRPYSY